MGRKSRRKRKSSALPHDSPHEALNLDPSIWRIQLGYSKGILADSRHTRVTVCHLPTGRTKETSFYANGKAAARRDAAAFVRQCVKEFQG